MDLARIARSIVIEHPGRPTAGAIRVFMRTLAPLMRLMHRPTLDGIEHLPHGPFLLVANHSAGLGVSEILSFAAEYLRCVGPDRPLAGFAHPLGFVIFPMSRIMHAVGAIPSGYEAAEKTLAQGIPLLVFPGGDHETMRPIWQANRVDFGGRVGFLRIARQAGVPIVPLGIRGGHMTGPVLLRSKLLATLLVVPRLAGVKRWGLSLLGLIGAIALALVLPWSWPLRALAIWLWLSSVLAFLPILPWTIRMRIGPPLAPSALFPDGPQHDTDDELRAALARVQSAVQALVDR